MRTQVFAYKGFLGIQSSPEGQKFQLPEGLLNDPMKPGQLGFVVDASFVDISPEALELLKKVPKSSDDIGEVDVWKCADGKVAFSWMGGPLKVFKAGHEDYTASSTYNPSLLTACTTEVEVPPAFITFVDKEIA